MKVREMQAALMAFDPEEELYTIENGYAKYEVVKIEKDHAGDIVID